VFACWQDPPENESKSTGLEEERSSAALQSEKEKTVFNSGKYEVKSRRRRLHN
jgi:hypothetical protein